MRRPGPKSKTVANAIKSADLGDSSGDSSSLDDRSISELSPTRASTRYGSVERQTLQDYTRSTLAEHSTNQSSTSEGSQNSVSAEQSTRTASRTAEAAQDRQEPGVRESPTATATQQRGRTGANKRKPSRHTMAHISRLNRLQEGEQLLIPKAPFGRLVREIMLSMNTEVTFVSFGALNMLHVSTEVYMEQRFADAYLLALHRGRKTLTAKDMALASYLKYSNLS